MVGLYGFRCMLDRTIKKESKEVNPLSLDNRRFQLEAFISGKSKIIKEALMRDPDPDLDYHEQGFDTLLELIEFIYKYPHIFKKEITW